MPVQTRDTLFAIPFSKRTPSEPYIPWAIPYRGRFVTVARTLGSIATEDYGKIGSRPLVAAETPAEGLFLGHWCFSRGILPLSREPNLDLTAQLAERYDIDSLLATADVLPAVLNVLRKKSPSLTLKYISVAGSSFSEELVRSVRETGGVVSLILALPETGSIASLCPQELEKNRRVFHPQERAVCELDSSLIVTIQSPLPLTRYDTELQVKKAECNCDCNKESFVLT